MAKKDEYGNLHSEENGQFVKKEDSDQSAKAKEIKGLSEKSIDELKEKAKPDKTEIKNKQLDIILQTNPMRDEQHVGIRSVDDIKTWEEAMQDDESFYWGDFEREDAEKALKKGSITIYSSYPIKNGVFVSTSYNQARDYAGGGKIYTAEVPLGDVAWINGDEGQFAKV